MSGPPLPPELAKLLASERAADGPPAEARDRMQARIEATLGLAAGAAGAAAAASATAKVGAATGKAAAISWQALSAHAIAAKIVIVVAATGGAVGAGLAVKHAVARHQARVRLEETQRTRTRARLSARPSLPSLAQAVAAGDPLAAMAAQMMPTTDAPLVPLEADLTAMAPLPANAPPASAMPSTKVTPANTMPSPASTTNTVPSPAANATNTAASAAATTTLATFERVHAKATHLHALTTTSATRSTSASVPSPSRTRSPSAAPRASTLAVERKLVESARTALLAQDFAAADTALAQHAARFPDGELAEERDSLRVRVAAARGDHDRARALADSFERDHPGSLFSAAVRRAAAE